LYTCWYTTDLPQGGNHQDPLDIGRLLVKTTWDGISPIPDMFDWPRELHYNTDPPAFYAARSLSVAGDYVFVRPGTDASGQYNEIQVYNRSDGIPQPVISLDNTNYYATAQNNDVADVAVSTRVRLVGNEYRIFTEGLSQSETHLIRWTPAALPPAPPVQPPHLMSGI
jgi:hypothetical protein